MAGEISITIVGNLTDDPELRFTPNGAAVAKFRVASTPRTLDRAAGEWKDGEPSFFGCTVWREMAEHVAESLSKGARVVVQGRIAQRNYETKEGEKRTVFEVEVDEIGPSLRYANAKPVKAQKGASSNGNGGGQRAAQADDPWADAAPARAGAGTRGNYGDGPGF